MDDEAPAHGAARFGWRDLVRLWSSASDGRRLRRPTDVLLLIGALLVLALLFVAAPGPTALDTAIVGLLAALPESMALLWGLSYTVLSLWALVLLLLPLAFRRRRRLFGDLVLAAVVALGGAVAVSAASGTDVAASLDGFVTTPTDPVYLAVRLAVATAIIVTASPHLSRPLRYWGRIIIMLGLVATVALEAALPIGAVSAAVVGLGAAAATHLLLGSPQGLLAADQVEIALADLGVDVDDATDLPDEIPGEVLWMARRADGPDLRVKVYGRDAWDTQAVGSAWGALTRRGESPGLGRSRQSRVEHEALALLLAQRAGVAVLPLVAAGQSGQGDALIATEQAKATLPDGPATDIDDAVVDGFWSSLVALHAAGMSHGRIDGRHLVLRANGSPALADFADAELNADEGDQQVDRARLLASTALVVGPERALASTVRVIGTDGLVELMPYLQPAAMGRTTRQQIKDEDWTLKDLKKAAVASLGVEAPPLQQLHRVSLKSVAIIALVGLMAYTLVGAFAGVDLQTIVETLSSANLAILLLALVLSPFVQASLAFSTIGSTLTKLKYVPVLMLQYGIQFIALVLPATAARLALEIRFFERFGIAAAPAVTMGMIDSFSGFTVQASLIILILLSGLASFSGGGLGGSSSSDTSSTDSDPSLLAILAVLGVVALIVTLIIPNLRHRVLGFIPRIRTAATEQRRKAGDALLVLRNPRKVGTMILGNLGAQVLQAVILGVTLAAFGQTASLAQLILINTAVSLFGGLMPVPGNIGVAEAAYTAGLQAIGIPAPIAVSTAIAFRLVTFYLPPLWGSVAMRWLRRHQFV